MTSQPLTPWSPTLPTLAGSSTDSLPQEGSRQESPTAEDMVSSRSSWETIPSDSEAKDSTPQIQPTLAPTPAEPAADDCVICKEPISNPATVKPCGHIFDLGCICSWVIHKGSGRTQCPLCNGLTTEIQHYSTDPSSAEPQLRTIPTGEVPEQQYGRPFGDGPGELVDEGLMRDFLEILVADEAVEEGMTDREIHAALERRRLRGLPERGDDILMRPPLSDFWVKDGDMFVMVGERYNFDIRQWDLFTKSKLVTTLSLQFKREDAFNVVPEYRKDRQALEAYAKIANIINEQIHRHMPESYIEKVTIDANRTEIRRDQRGILSQLDRTTSIIREAHEETPFRLRLRQETNLTEKGPANKDDDLEPLTPEEQTADRLRREEYLRMARTDIQRIIRERARVAGANPNLELDRATTNLLEPIQQSSEKEDSIWWRGVNEVLNFRPFRRT